MTRGAGTRQGLLRFAPDDAASVFMAALLVAIGCTPTVAGAFGWKPDYPFAVTLMQVVVAAFLLLLAAAPRVVVEFDTIRREVRVVRKRWIGRTDTRRIAFTDAEALTIQDERDSDGGTTPFPVIVLRSGERVRLANSYSILFGRVKMAAELTRIGAATGIAVTTT